MLVNNAGTFEERDYAADKNLNATLDAEVALNLTAPIHLTGEVLERWPSPDAIVFITSGFALVSPTRAPTHGAVKAGLHGFADGLRRQLAPQGHTHVLEVPPSTDTPTNAEATGKKLTPAQVAAVTMKAARRVEAMPCRGGSSVRLSSSPPRITHLMASQRSLVGVLQGARTSMGGRHLPAPPPH